MRETSFIQELTESEKVRANGGENLVEYFVMGCGFALKKCARLAYALSEPYGEANPGPRQCPI